MEFYEYVESMTLNEFIEFLNQFKPIEPDLSEIFDEDLDELF